MRSTLTVLTAPDIISLWAAYHRAWLARTVAILLEEYRSPDWDRPWGRGHERDTADLNRQR